MEVGLPAGCNVFYGDYIDNYNGSVRTRYYFGDDGSLIQSSRQSNSSRPTNSVCMSGPYYWRPDIAVTYSFYSFCLIFFAIFIIYQLFIKKLWAS
nr:MAG: transmembrane and TPR repeat-containing protein [uncultured bacterium]